MMFYTYFNFVNDVIAESNGKEVFIIKTVYYNNVSKINK